MCVCKNTPHIPTPPHTPHTPHTPNPPEVQELIAALCVLRHMCRELRSSIVGKRYWVWWPGESLWYRCTVTSWLPEPAVHEVL